MSTLNREEFEEWLEDHTAAALEQVDGDELSLLRWIALFQKTLRREAMEEIEDEDEYADDDVDEIAVED